MELLWVLLGRTAYFFTPFFLVPIVYGLIMDELGTWVFVLSVIVVLVIGTLLLRLGRIKEKTKQLPVHDGAMFLVFSWFFLSCLGTIPFLIFVIMDIVQLSLVDIFVETMSALTTTGITNISSELPSLLILWRSLICFGGSLFFVIIIMTVLPVVSGNFGVSISKKSSGTFNSVLMRIGDPLKKTIGFFIIVAIIWTIIFILLGLPSIQAISLALYAVSTGGGSIYGVVQNNMGIIIAISTVSIFASLSVFIWWEGIRERSLKHVIQDAELKGFLITALIAGLILSLVLLFNKTPLIEALSKGFFYAISFLSTNSFILEDFDSMQIVPDFLRLFCTFLSMIGGMVATTAGGIGMLRILILLSLLNSELRRTLHPRMVVIVRIGRDIVSNNITIRVMFLFFIYAIVIMMSSIILSLAMNKPIEALVLTLGCIFSAGGVPALYGVTTLEILPVWAKLFCICLMVIGRIEIIALLVLIEGIWEHNSNTW